MSDNKARTRVAIACEGGGTHTAFTAGVLKRLLHEPIDIVGLSGTSGGAVCAMLAWRGLLAGDREDAMRRLEAFWRENSVEGLEALWGTWFRLSTRLLGEVASPEVSPYRWWWDASEQFKQLLERHCGFAEVPDLLRTNPLAPRLLIGAAEVRSGEFTVFRSHPVTHRGITYPAAQLSADVILASAAVPTLFKAAHIDGHDYWDGVFAQNPPVRELPDMVRTIPGGGPPDEIWVVRINQRTCETVPKSMAKIRDRRNEMAGIISLDQELYVIDLLNQLIEAGSLTGAKHEAIALRSIEMDDEFASPLEYESKLDRSRPFLESLQAHGWTQADKFLRDPDRHLEPAGAREQADPAPRLVRGQKRSAV